MIALRARRQAYRIAADFLYDEPIEVETFPCRSCGQQIRAIEVDEFGWIRCEVCGVRNLALPHLRSRVPARVVPLVRKHDHWERRDDDARHRRRMLVLALIIYVLLSVAWLIAYMG
jgi:hypothetical protein